ncbi:hypothetical protein MRB53_036374 [Persea americana]|nr:hypothetical protein MRB53_037223 [Persea americana]KAJ8614708.1 hypothetical protein MRB53_036374 [Persea americana]
MDEKKLSLVSVVFAEPYFLFYGRVLLDKIRRTALRRFFRCIPPPSFGGGRKGLDFSAMISPVVHIGAIAASFLFVVMMFNIQIAETHEEVLRYLPLLAPSGSKNGFSAQQPEQTGRLSPGIVVVLFGSGLGRMPGYLEKDSPGPCTLKLSSPYEDTVSGGRFPFRVALFLAFLVSIFLKRGSS